MKIGFEFSRGTRSESPDTQAKAEQPETQARELPSGGPAPAKRRRSVRSRSMGSFLQAAETGNTSAKWSTRPQSAGQIIERDWLATVARSRDICQNDPHGSKFISMVRDNIPGPNGFVLHARIKNAGGTIDKGASDAIESAWKNQRKAKNWDVEGELSGAAMEKLACASIAQDGEVIGVVEMGAGASPTRFGVRLVDPVCLEPNYFKDLGNGNVIRHGIEYTDRGRKVAYHFRVYSDERTGVLTYSGDRYERVPAEFVIHVFVPFMVGARRGLPWTKAAMWRMRQLGAYEDASVVKARVGASDMILFEDEDGDDEDRDFELDVEPGTGRTLPGGYKPHFWNPTFPNGDFEPFSRRMLQSMSSGLNVSYNSLASDLSSVNFSSIRQGTLEERKMWLSFQLWFEEAWCLPIYELWLEHSLLSDRILVKGRPLRYDRMERYQEVTFIGRRWDWIDPATEIKALQAEIDLKLKSRSRAIRERGEDPMEVWAEIEEEEKEMRSRGLDPVIAQPGAAPKGQPSKSEKTSKED